MKASGIWLEPVRRIGISPAVIVRIFTMAWLTFLIVGSLQPARPSIVKSVHREIHWVGFAAPAILQFVVSRSRRQEVLSAFAIFFLGLSLEVLQHLIYRNPMEWFDIRDDGLAIFTAFAIYRLTGAFKLVCPK